MEKINFVAAINTIIETALIQRSVAETLRHAANPTAKRIADELKTEGDNLVDELWKKLEEDKGEGLSQDVKELIESISSDMDEIRSSVEHLEIPDENAVSGAYSAIEEAESQLADARSALDDAPDFEEMQRLHSGLESEVDAIESKISDLVAKI